MAEVEGWRLCMRQLWDLENFFRGKEDAQTETKGWSFPPDVFVRYEACRCV